MEECPTKLLLTQRINNYKNLILKDKQDQIKTLQKLDEIVTINQLDIKNHFLTPIVLEKNAIKEDRLLKPTFNLDFSDGLNNQLTSKEINLNVKKEEIKDNPNKLTKKINSIRKSSSFSFERVIKEDDPAYQEEKRRNFSYFSNQTSNFQ